jgi:hypothetical protein
VFRGQKKGARMGVRNAGSVISYKIERIGWASYQEVDSK